MNTAEYLNAMEKLAKDEAAVEQIANAKDCKAFEAVLVANGIELEADQVEELYKFVQEKRETGVDEAELSVDDLDNVAGGFGVLGMAVIYLGGVAIVTALAAWSTRKR